jgi:hypothetical protein
VYFNPTFARFDQESDATPSAIGIFVIMKEQLPIKRLNLLSCLLAAIIGIIFHIIISHNSDDPKIYFFTLFTVLGVVMVGFADVSIMIILSKKYRSPSRKFRVWRYVVTYPISIIIYLLVWPIIAYAAHDQWSYADGGLFLAFVGSGIVINTMILILHDSVLLYEHKLSSELELSRLKAANAEAANLLLKQQIQPHFLFNALNTLKALYHNNTQTADTYIVHMANFLRASVFRHTSNISSLADELGLLNDYLAMQRIRFGSALNCSIAITNEEIKDSDLPSFSLQPLLENAIKHNNFTQQDPLNITIVQVGDRLIFSNNIQKKKIKSESTSYGLANLAERYRLCCGDDIIIEDDEKSFSVSIKLLKHEDRNY